MATNQHDSTAGGPRVERSAGRGPNPRPALLTQIGRALRLRCPRCGTGALFRSWFRMLPRCETCGLKYEREAGFFLGAIYFNYGLTSLVAAIAYPILLLSGTLSRNQTFAVTLAWIVLFPLWFFRYARSLWLGFDYFCDRTPRAGDGDGSGDAR